MKPKLSIIIPTIDEKETPVILKQLNQQRDCHFEDFEIIIVFDGFENKLNSNWIYNIDYDDSSNLNFKILETDKNVGPGLARQYGLDHAKGDYVTFIDRDDTIESFHFLNWFENIHSALMENNVDKLETPWICHGTDKSGKDGFVPNEKGNNIWLFGNFYNREFLKFHEIAFHRDLRWAEDTAFNWNVLIFDPNVQQINFSWYIWENTEDSITRFKRDEYSFACVTPHAQARELMIEKALKLSKIDKTTAQLKAAQELVMLYQTLGSIEWHNERSKPYHKELIDYAGYLKTRYDIKFVDEMRNIAQNYNEKNLESWMHDLPKISKRPKVTHEYKNKEIVNEHV